MGTLVLYRADKNTLALYDLDKPHPNAQFWKGQPYVIWSTLEIAISYGWEVVGEL